MARRREDRAANEARGRRLAEIRNALGVSQYDFAERLNAAARELGLPASYRYYTVSRNEAGTIGFEDAAVWLSLDPERRGWEWLVFGQEAPVAVVLENHEREVSPPSFPASTTDARRDRHVGGQRRRRK